MANEVSAAKEQKLELLRIEIDNLKKSIETNNRQHQEMIDQANEYYERAESENRIDLTGLGNSMRKLAKEKAAKGKDLTEKLNEKQSALKAL